MKRILMGFGILGITITTAFGAATVCVKPDVSMVVLDPAVAPSSVGNSGTTWWGQFSYGLVKGFSTVYETNINGVPNDTHQAAITASTATSGYCFCKMTSPVESKWVRWHSGNSSVTYTSRICAVNCSDKAIKTNDHLVRTELFSSAIILP